MVFIDDDICIPLIMEAIGKAKLEKKSWIIEGFPRTLPQMIAI
jgi:adenylate kinase family enzyme